MCICVYADFYIHGNTSPKSLQRTKIVCIFLFVSNRQTEKCKSAKSVVLEGLMGGFRPERVLGAHTVRNDPYSVSNQYSTFKE